MKKIGFILIIISSFLITNVYASADEAAVQKGIKILESNMKKNKIKILCYKKYGKSPKHYNACMKKFYSKNYKLRKMPTLSDVKGYQKKYNEDKKTVECAKKYGTNSMAVMKCMEK